MGGNIPNKIWVNHCDMHSLAESWPEAGESAAYYHIPDELVGRFKSFNPWGEGDQVGNTIADLLAIIDS